MSQEVKTQSLVESLKPLPGVRSCHTSDTERVRKVVDELRSLISTVRAGAKRKTRTRKDTEVDLALQKISGLQTASSDSGVHAIALAKTVWSWAGTLENTAVSSDLVRAIRDLCRNLVPELKEDDTRPFPVIPLDSESSSPGRNDLTEAQKRAIARVLKTAGYDVQKLLGVGGMGAVFLVLQEGVDRQVALKLLLNAKDEKSLKGFRSEVATQAKMADQHPGWFPVVHTADVVEEEGGTRVAYLVMKLEDCPTQTLSPYVSEAIREKMKGVYNGEQWRVITETLRRELGETFPKKTWKKLAAYWAKHTARIYAFINQEGHLHRDCKGENHGYSAEAGNIMIDFLNTLFSPEKEPVAERVEALAERELFLPLNTLENPVRVFDFGLTKKVDISPQDATLTISAGASSDVSTLFGTQGYMSGQVIQGELSHLGRDLFAWGVAVWEGYTGQKFSDTVNIARLYRLALQSDTKKQDTTTPHAAVELSPELLGEFIDEQDQDQANLLYEFLQVLREATHLSTRRPCTKEEQTALWEKALQSSDALLPSALRDEKVAREHAQRRLVSAEVRVRQATGVVEDLRTQITVWAAAEQKERMRAEGEKERADLESAKAFEAVAGQVHVARTLSRTKLVAVLGLALVSGAGMAGAMRTFTVGKTVGQRSAIDDEIATIEAMPKGYIPDTQKQMNALEGLLLKVEAKPETSDPGILQKLRRMLEDLQRKQERHYLASAMALEKKGILLKRRDMLELALSHVKIAMAYRKSVLHEDVPSEWERLQARLEEKIKGASDQKQQGQ